MIIMLYALYTDFKLIVKYILCSLHSVPAPAVTVSTDTDIVYAGTRDPLILMCNITIDSAFDSFVTVSITWLRGMTPLSNNTDHVTISPLSGSQSPLTSSLTLSPPSIEDNTTFTCRAGAIPSAELSTATASDLGKGMITIIVQGKCLMLASKFLIL